MKLDFTFEKYRQLINILKERRYAFYTFKDIVVNNTNLKSPHVILRHDVDRLPMRALKLARLEYILKIKSTYFFRSKPISFDEKIIKRIVDWGHEIGYHYEDFSGAKGNKVLAWKSFKNNLAKFNKFGKIVSIAMHGSPLSKWDNRILWDYYDYRELGVKIEAYKDIPWDNYIYFTDVGRSWDSKDNLRDRVKGFIYTNKKIKTTDELIDYICNSDHNFIISTHPERWTDNKIGWLQVLITDTCLNFIKKIYRKIVIRNENYCT